MQNKKINLKKFEIADAEKIFNLIDGSRKHLSQTYRSGNKDKTADKYQTLEDVLNSIRNPPNPDKLRFGIWNKGQLVGSINLSPSEGRRAEIGYYIGAKFINRGYATLATITLTNYAFQQGFNKLYAKVEFGNNASARVLEKGGFLERTKRNSKKRFFVKERSD